MQKPTGKQIAILNIVNNTPMAIVMSTVAPLLAGMPLMFSGWLTNVIIAFVIACIINLVIPVPLIAVKFPALFKLDPHSFIGRVVGTLLLAAIFVLIIGLLLNLYNVRVFPIFIFAFLDTFLPLYLVCFVVAMIFNPVADKLAFGSR
ncbi:MAG: hypothetical protein ACRDBO_11845 [Lachnospiraceae bacterium]